MLGLSLGPSACEAETVPLSHRGGPDYRLHNSGLNMCFKNFVLAGADKLHEMEGKEGLTL